MNPRSGSGRSPYGTSCAGAFGSHPGHFDMDTTLSNGMERQYRLGRRFGAPTGFPGLGRLDDTQQ